MTLNCIAINSKAKVVTEKFETREEFEKAFNEFQEELKDKWK